MIFNVIFIFQVTDLDGIQILDSITPEVPGSNQEEYTISKRKRKGCLKEISFTRQKHMTPRKQFLYNAVVGLKKTLSVVNKRHLTTKQRLEKIRKIH